MFINEIKIENFRCFDYLDLRFTNKTNYIFGSNGVGKTSVVEAIYLISNGKSFRTNQHESLVKDSFSLFNVSCQGMSRGDYFNIKLRNENRRNNFSINFNENIRTLDILNTVACLANHSNTINIVDGDAFNRRRLIDWWLFYSEPGYFLLWQKFSRTLKQRNFALKNDPLSVTHWDQLLSHYGEMINAHRIGAFSQIRDNFHENFNQLRLFNYLSIDFFCGWPDNQSLMEILEKNRDKDRRFGHTTAGPHRADLVFLKKNSRIKEFFSRGQKKLFTIIFLLNLGILFNKYFCEYPIMLLDDFSSDLDDHSKSIVMDIVNNLGLQVIITDVNQNIGDFKKFNPNFIFLE